MAMKPWLVVAAMLPLPRDVVVVLVMVVAHSCCLYFCSFLILSTFLLYTLRIFLLSLCVSFYLGLLLSFLPFSPPPLTTPLLPSPPPLPSLPPRHKNFDMALLPLTFTSSLSVLLIRYECSRPFFSRSLTCSITSSSSFSVLICCPSIHALPLSFFSSIPLFLSLSIHQTPLFSSSPPTNTLTFILPQPRPSMFIAYRHAGPGSCMPTDDQRALW